MRLRERIRWEREAETPGYLFDTRHGGVFGLTPTSALVLEGLSRDLDEDQLVNELTTTFAVNELAARIDLRSFLTVLVENDLVEP